MHLVAVFANCSTSGFRIPSLHLVLNENAYRVLLHSTSDYMLRPLKRERMNGCERSVPTLKGFAHTYLRINMAASVAIYLGARHHLRILFVYLSPAHRKRVVLSQPCLFLLLIILFGCHGTSASDLQHTSYNIVSAGKKNFTISLCFTYTLQHHDRYERVIENKDIQHEQR